MPSKTERGIVSWQTLGMETNKKVETVPLSSFRARRMKKGILSIPISLLMRHGRGGSNHARLNAAPSSPFFRSLVSSLEEMESMRGFVGKNHEFMSVLVC